jgi:hypothetical protein
VGLRAVESVTPSASVVTELRVDFLLVGEVAAMDGRCPSEEMSWVRASPAEGVAVKWVDGRKEDLDGTIHRLSFGRSSLGKRVSDLFITGLRGYICRIRARASSSDEGKEIQGAAIH